MKAYARPGVLLAALLLGSGIGLYSHRAAALFAVVGGLITNLLLMAALPLLVVAAVFGLRNMMALPRRGARILLVLGAALLVLVASGEAGACAGLLASWAIHFDAPARARLGALIERAGGRSPGATIELLAAPTAAAHPVSGLGWIFDNPFQALVEGNLPAMLGCALAFGLAFARMPRERTQALAGQLEAAYRGLEGLIGGIIRLLPLLCLGMGARVASEADGQALRLFAGIVLALLGAALPLAWLALRRIASAAGCGLIEAGMALQAPLLIALVAPTPLAAIPATIDALSNRLGLSRGVTELLVPLGAVFLPAGSALYAALLTVFIGHLYGAAPDLRQVLGIGVLAAAASVAAPRAGGLGTLAAAGLTMGWLRLPVDGVLPVLLLIDSISNGPRQILALLALGAVCAEVSRGLPAERRSNHQPLEAPPEAPPPVRVTLSGVAIACIALCAAAAAALVALAGIGVGARIAARPAPHWRATP